MSGGSKWLQESRLDKEAINEIIKDPRGSKWLQECPLDIEIIKEIIKEFERLFWKFILLGNINFGQKLLSYGEWFLSNLF